MLIPIYDVSVSYQEITDDIAPYYGTGFYKRRRKNGVTSFTAIWLYKTQYSEPTENTETKGDAVNFQTPTINCAENDT